MERFCVWTISIIFVYLTAKRNSNNINNNIINNNINNTNTKTNTKVNNKQ